MPLPRRTAAILLAAIAAAAALPHPMAHAGGLPNLSMTEQWFWGTHQCDGLVMGSFITNDGEAEAGSFKVALVIDFVPVDQQRVKRLDPGETIEVVFVYRHPVTNDTDAEFWLDFDDRIVESDEDDNLDGDTLWPICGSTSPASS
jgi:CARDB protein